ncbi:MAG: rod shape-determining protein RodA [Desulfobacterales bacterium]|nr:rod shape-determining protein RodA [Desulfobacterales bacterium]
MIDRRLVQNFDWGLLGVTLLLALFGFLTLYSATATVFDGSHKLIYIKQIIWFCGGFVVMVMAFMINYKLLDRWADIVYIFCVILLLSVLIFGKFVGGSRRWLVFGPFSIQPSEMAKITIIIVLAKYYSNVASPKGLEFRQLIKPIVYTCIPFILIVKQPDLGTALLLAFIAVAMTVFVKIERRTFCCLLGSGIIFVPLVWFILKDYQKKRILTFLNPDRDPLGAGYHIIQSKIAIGSGMITGKGYLEGTQNVLSFLPEQHTDFIFSVLAEEWGFIGTTFLLFLFFMLIFWGLKIAHRSKDPFGTMLAFGITSMIFFQVMINIGMVMGLMPVVGVPLPLISYGGSSMITIMVSIGLLINISIRRFMFE